MNGLDLFSGIGGITKALESWVKPIAYCERDRYAQAVLLSRMGSNDITTAPIWDDVRTLHGWMLPRVDIIYGGFPCQDISVAGNGKGLAGERSGLFFEIMRLAKEIKPKFIFLENVPAIRKRGLSTVIGELTQAGYDCRYGFLSAYDVGAPHLRERWFLLAHTNSERIGENTGTVFREQNTRHETWRNGIIHRCSDVDNSVCGRYESPKEEVLSRRDSAIDASWWETESSVGRVVNELPNRVDRIKCLGNAVVPKQVKEAFERLMTGCWS